MENCQDVPNPRLDLDQLLSKHLKWNILQESQISSDCDEWLEHVSVVIWQLEYNDFHYITPNTIHHFHGAFNKIYFTSSQPWRITETQRIKTGLVMCKNLLQRPCFLLFPTSFSVYGKFCTLGHTSGRHEKKTLEVLRELRKCIFRYNRCRIWKVAIIYHLQQIYTLKSLVLWCLSVCLRSIENVNSI